MPFKPRLGSYWAPPGKAHMHTISKYLTDRTFLEKAFAYLETHHRVRAVIVDKDGQVDPLKGLGCR